MLRRVWGLFLATDPRNEQGNDNVVFLPRRIVDATFIRGVNFKMTSETLLVWLLVGAIAGWLAGNIMRGAGFGLVGNIVIGIIGSFVGGWLFSHFHIVHGGGLIGEIIGATVGAIALLFVIGATRRVA